MDAIAKLQMLRQARERQYDISEAAKRRGARILKVLFWTLMSPMILAIIAALWGMHDVAVHAAH